MKQKLWSATNKVKRSSNLYKFEKFLSKNYNYKVSKNYSKLLNWSIKNKEKFWSSVWDFCKVTGEKNYKFKYSKNLFSNKFLVNSKLNFAENLLLKNDDSKAITFISERGHREVRSWKKLNYNVSKIIELFKKIDIKEKDRVACYLPNIIETVESFIATASIGAIWSSCSPDFGANGLIERFAQIKPKVLIISDRYYYNGKEINIIERLSLILKKIKSIKTVIVINYPGKNYINHKKKKRILLL